MLHRFTSKSCFMSSFSHIGARAKRKDESHGEIIRFHHLLAKLRSLRSRNSREQSIAGTTQKVSSLARSILRCHYMHTAKDALS